VRVYERWDRVRQMDSPQGYLFRTAIGGSSGGNAVGPHSHDGDRQQRDQPTTTGAAPPTPNSWLDACVRPTAYGFRKHDSGRGLACLEAVRVRHEPDGGRIPSADELAPVASRRPLWRPPPRRRAPGRPRSAGSPVRSPGRTRTQGLRGSPFEDPLSKDRFSPASSEHAGRPYRRISTHLDERNQESRPGYLWQSARSRVESGAVTICSPTRLHVQWL